MAPKKHGNNRKIDKKVAAALARRPVPPPPTRRPNIQERISMLQMAQLYHKNDYIPAEECCAYRLVLPEVPPAYAARMVLLSTTTTVSNSSSSSSSGCSPVHNNKRKARRGLRFWRKRQNS